MAGAAMTEAIRVQIVDPAHPHFPEHGVLTGKIITMKFSGESMAELKLEACRHGTDACFVGKGQVERERVIKEGNR